MFYRSQGTKNNEKNIPVFIGHSLYSIPCVDILWLIKCLYSCIFKTFCEKWCGCFEKMFYKTNNGECNDSEIKMKVRVLSAQWKKVEASVTHGEVYIEKEREKNSWVLNHVTMIKLASDNQISRHLHKNLRFWYTCIFIIKLKKKKGCF